LIFDAMMCLMWASLLLLIQGSDSVQHDCSPLSDKSTMVGFHILQQNYL